MLTPAIPFKNIRITRNDGHRNLVLLMQHLCLCENAHIIILRQIMVLDESFEALVQVRVVEFQDCIGRRIQLIDSGPMQSIRNN